MKHLLLFTLITLSSASLIAQTITETDIESDEWYPVYKTSTLTLYVQFAIPLANEICNNGAPTRFMYRYKGELLPSEKYGVWELDYLDCGGITKKMTAYAPLSGSCDGWGNPDRGEEFNFRESDEKITAQNIIELRALNLLTGTYNSPAKVEVILKNSFAPKKICPLEEGHQP